MRWLKRKKNIQNTYSEAEQRNRLLTEHFESICLKCEYGDAIEQLSEQERTFYMTQILQQEVNNGGFAQFFYNSAGDFSNEIVEAFEKIGAAKTAAICKRALSVFPGPVPTDRSMREKWLDDLDCDEIWETCDDAFYDCEEDLAVLTYEYMHNASISYRLFNA